MQALGEEVRQWSDNAVFRNHIVELNWERNFSGSDAQKLLEARRLPFSDGRIGETREVKTCSPFYQVLSKDFTNWTIFKETETKEVNVMLLQKNFLKWTPIASFSRTAPSISFCSLTSSLETSLEMWHSMVKQKDSNEVHVNQMPLRDCQSHCMIHQTD